MLRHFTIKNILTLIIFSFVLLASLQHVRADAVSDWNDIAVQRMGIAGRPAASGAIDIAVVHAAIYDAVQAIERRYEPYYVEIPGATGSPIAATAKAARDVLVNRFPAQAGDIDIQYSDYLILHGISVNDPGIAVGARAAAAIIAARSCDQSFPAAFTPFNGVVAVGRWRPTTPGTTMAAPWQAGVAPFLGTRPSQFRSGPPPALSSVEYARDFNEVKRMGALTGSSRTAAQTDQAQFWAGNFVVMLNRMLRDLAASNITDIADSAKLFAMADLAMADAVNAAWYDKIYHNVWRPVTAIHEADKDGNPRTAADESWASLINSPPYPDYVSGANAITAAAVFSCERFFGTDNMSFSVFTTNTANTIQDVREFNKFSDVAEEVVDARIWLGIHFRFADVKARTLGREVAAWGHQNYFRPTTGPDMLLAQGRR